MGILLGLCLNRDRVLSAALRLHSGQECVVTNLDRVDVQNALRGWNKLEVDDVGQGPSSIRCRTFGTVDVVGNEAQYSRNTDLAKQ